MTFEFVIKIVGSGDNQEEAWKDAKQSAEKKIRQDNYDEANDISE